MYCAASFRFNLSVFGFRYPKCCKNPQGVKMKKSPKRPDLAYGSQTISAHITSVFYFIFFFQLSVFFSKISFFRKRIKEKILVLSWIRFFHIQIFFQITQKRTGSQITDDTSLIETDCARIT